MWGKRSKRWDTEQTDSLIGPHSQVHGDIHFSGLLHVEGTIRGNVVADGNDESALRLIQTGTPFPLAQMDEAHSLPVK